MTRAARVGVILGAVLAQLAGAGAAAAQWGSGLPAAGTIPRLEVAAGPRAGTCSATVVRVEDGWAYALTNAHCLEHGAGERLDVTANDQHAVELGANRILDLAVVKFRAQRDTVAIVLAPTPPATGAAIAVVGYAFGVGELVAQFGHVAQTFNAETRTIWLDVVTIVGDSGGAVVDEQRRLVAINARVRTAASAPASHISMAVPITTLRDFLDAVLPAAKRP